MKIFKFVFAVVIALYSVGAKCQVTVDSLSLETAEIIFAEVPDLELSVTGVIPADVTYVNICMQDITPLDLKVGEKKSKEFDVSFKPVQLIAPLSLIAVGTFGYYSKAFHKLNDKVRDGMTHIRGDHYLHFDDYLQYLPAAAYLGLGFYKGGRKLDWRERVAVEITAYLAMTAVTNIAKYSFKEKRPDSNARNSFPSGHTATTFTGAELIRKEFGWGIGGAAYAVATGVAFLRLYNGRHWLNDVIAGAGIGILSAQIGYWMLPHYRKWFHWDKKKNQQVCSIMPSYNDHTLSINMVMVF